MHGKAGKTAWISLSLGILVTASPNQELRQMHCKRWGIGTGKIRSKERFYDDLKPHLKRDYTAMAFRLLCFAKKADLFPSI